jgi:hypothetical protein
VHLWRQESGEWREFNEVAGEWIKKAYSSVMRLVDEHEESLGGEGDHLMVMELRDVDQDAFGGGCIQEAPVRFG